MSARREHLRTKIRELQGYRDACLRGDWGEGMRGLAEGYQGRIDRLALLDARLAEDEGEASHA